jgi:hypothetical protein
MLPLAFSAGAAGGGRMGHPALSILRGKVKVFRWIFS